MPSTPCTPRTFQQFIHGVNVLNSSNRNQQQSSKQRSSGTRRSFTSLFPVLPNPFGQTHPALRSPTSTRSVIDSAMASPASIRTRFSAMASNPFFTRHAEAPSVLDYGGNMPIEVPDSVRGTESSLSGSVGESRREWPAPTGRRRRRTRKRTSQKTSAPILFPAMQSSRVRTKMLQSLILGSILVTLLITCKSAIFELNEIRY